MNMAANNITIKPSLTSVADSTGFDTFIKEEVSILSELHEKRITELKNCAKSFLDQVFPLDSGSHKDVSSYVIYYKHLLAFFPDGSNSGLQQPKQFVALSGHKNEPTSIVLKSDGAHIELIFNKNGSRGIKDIAGIDDIQIETTKAIFGSTQAANDETRAQKTRHWFSMMRSPEQLTTNRAGQQTTRDMEMPKAFTDKYGEEYSLA